MARRFENVKADSNRAVQAADSYNQTASGIVEAQNAADEAYQKAFEAETIVSKI